MVVITGVSGSGKSSLAFDAIFKEGQRRYLETFSSYARQFIGNYERPDVDFIEGLSPVISIEQKTVSKNPRSTIGTVTEIYDFLRLLYARLGRAHSYITGKEMVRFSQEQMISQIWDEFKERKIVILAPVVHSRKGNYKELFEQIFRRGFMKVRADGEIIELNHGLQLDRYKTHDIEIVIDRILLSKDKLKRLRTSLTEALTLGNGQVYVLDYDNGDIKKYSKNLMCLDSGVSYSEPEPNSFSFNSPYGWCKTCQGLGIHQEVDMDLIIQDPELSIKDGSIIPLGKFKDSVIFKQIKGILAKHKKSLSDPLNSLPKEALDTILEGTHGGTIEVYLDMGSDYGVYYNLEFEGILNLIRRHSQTGQGSLKKWALEFMKEGVCPDCKGHRLKKQSLNFFIHDINISEASKLNIRELNLWLNNLESTLGQREKLIAKDLMNEIKKRAEFLMNIGLDYLNLDRAAKTLSGGESQRIRIAAQLASQLTGVLYILDEPTIGLHPSDNERLINSLKSLVKLGNSVIVVEHDKEIMLNSDHIIDMGPGAGSLGGEVMENESKDNFIANNDNLTAQYLRGEKGGWPENRRNGNGSHLHLIGASGHNLKGVSVQFPLGKMICVTGVSGSGKSTLIHHTLFPLLSQHFYRSKKQALKHKVLLGAEHLDKVIEIDQSPIGKTPRSNPSTYVGFFNEIRQLFSQLPESKMYGFKIGRFSFNVKGGRCEACEGAGVRIIEMNYLPDVSVICEACQGKRFNPETLSIRFKGKSIYDVLDMTVDEAMEFFDNQSIILRKIKALHDVGLGYIHLGQSSTTLSGGEAQRIKLASELCKKDTGKTLYILDEPTTGLHFEDVRVLMEVLNNLVDKGNTVLIIEHNIDVIKCADHIIDLGPEGGGKGGEIIAIGSPEEVIKNKNSLTAKFLSEEAKHS
jgi:excinuclease ABC subunit A